MIPVGKKAERVWFSPLTADWIPAYLRFAAATFGPKSYQANRAYLDWLYRESPLGADYGDCRLALRSNEVVGCIHRMRMTWRYNGESSQVVPSIHNTMVRPDCREGAGGLLIAQAFRGEPYAFVPGAEGEVAKALRRLGFAAQTIRWWVTWLRPVAAAVCVVGAKLGVRSGGHRRFSNLQANAPVDLEELVEMANTSWPVPSDFRCWWSVDLFRWRYFSTNGPATTLVTLREKDELRGYALLSFGMRRDLFVARVIDWRVVSQAYIAGLFRRTEDTAFRRGAHLLMVGSGDSELSDWFTQLGWRERVGAAQAFLYCRERKRLHDKVSFMPGAGDYGLEALVSP